MIALDGSARVAGRRAARDARSRAPVRSLRAAGSHVPPRRFVSAQDAHNEIRPRSKCSSESWPLKAAQELPRVPRRTADESLWGLCKGECAFLCRVRKHCEIPLSRRICDCPILRRSAA